MEVRRVFWAQPDLPHISKVSRRYTPDFGGHGLYADPRASKLGSPQSIVGSKVRLSVCMGAFTNITQYFTVQ